MARKLKAVFFDLNHTLHDDSAECFFAEVRSTCQQFADRNGLPSADRLMETYLKIKFAGPSARRRASRRATGPVDRYRHRHLGADAG
jgi:hypothetical protein